MTDTGAPGGLADGLCNDCTHARRVRSARRSLFIRCNLSLSDPSYPKYPRLPVVTCAGYERGPSTAAPRPD